MKTILISGVSGSIGQFMAEYFLNKGYSVVGLSRKNCEIANFPSLYHNFLVDLTDEQSVLSLFKTLRSQKTALDGFIHCAGLSASAISTSVSKDVVKEIFDTNVTGSIVLLREVVKNMNVNRTGSVINMSSITASIFNNGSATYASSKVAFEQFCKQMAIENARFGVRINSLRLPAIENTKMNASLSDVMKSEILNNTMLKRELKLQEVANLCNWLLSDDAAVVTGETITPGGIW